jgi:hypothetical protein
MNLPLSLYVLINRFLPLMGEIISKMTSSLMFYADTEPVNYHIINVKGIIAEVTIKPYVNEKQICQAEITSLVFLVVLFLTTNALPQRILYGCSCPFPTSGNLHTPSLSSSAATALKLGSIHINVNHNCYFKCCSRLRIRRSRSLITLA